MGRLLRTLIVGSALAVAVAVAPAAVRAQAPVAGASTPYRLNAYFAAPGLYGTSWGAASYGMPRTYTAFSSPFGVGYGYGYAPYGILPGRYGVGLWRPGFVAPGYAYGASYYRTFAVPYVAGAPTNAPSIGVYAPGFGPSSFYGW